MAPSIRALYLKLQIACIAWKMSTFVHIFVQITVYLHILDECECFCTFAFARQQKTPVQTEICDWLPSIMLAIICAIVPVAQLDRASPS